MERKGVTFYEDYSEFLRDQFGIELSEEIAEEVIERSDVIEKYEDFSEFRDVVMSELEEMYPGVPDWLWNFFYFHWNFEEFLWERSADGDFDVYEFRNGEVIRVWCGDYDEVKETIRDVLLERAMEGIVKEWLKEEFGEEGEE